MGAGAFNPGALRLEWTCPGPHSDPYSLWSSQFPSLSLSFFICTWGIRPVVGIQEELANTKDSGWQVDVDTAGSRGMRGPAGSCLPTLSTRDPAESWGQSLHGTTGTWALLGPKGENSGALGNGAPATGPGRVPTGPGGRPPFCSLKATSLAGGCDVLHRLWKPQSQKGS